MGIPAEQQLFYKESFFDFERRKKTDIESDIERMSDDDLLRPNQKEMLDYLVETYELDEIYLDKDNIYKSYKQDKGNICDYFGERIYTDILIVYWNIPFEGSDGLLFVQPSKYLMSDFRAAFDNGCLIISDYATIADIQRELDFIENKLKKQLNGFLTQITNLNADIRRYNSSLRTFIIDIMEKRRKKSDIVKKALEKMDIPLKRNPNAPSIIPMRKKLVRKSMPTAEREKLYGISDQAGEWEFKLSTTDYEKTIHVFLFDIYENIESKEL